MGARWSEEKTLIDDTILPLSGDYDDEAIHMDNPGSFSCWFNNVILILIPRPYLAGASKIILCLTNFIGNFTSKI